MNTINIYKFNNGQSYWICPICKTPKLGNLNNYGFMGCKHVNGNDFMFNQNQHKTNIIDVAQFQSGLCENTQSMDHNIENRILKEISDKLIKLKLKIN